MRTRSRRCRRLPSATRTVVSARTAASGTVSPQCALRSQLVVRSPSMCNCSAKFASCGLPPMLIRFECAPVATAGSIPSAGLPARHAVGVRVRRVTSLVPSAAAPHGLGGAHTGDDHWVSIGRPVAHTHMRAHAHTHARRSEGYSTDALQSISINNPSGGDYKIAVRTAWLHPH